VQLLSVGLSRVLIRHAPGPRQRAVCLPVGLHAPEIFAGLYVTRGGPLRR